MRKFRLRRLVAVVLIFGAVVSLHAWLTRLPHKKLRTGGEFRVFAVRYGAGSDAQAYRRAPRWQFRTWEALPKRLQELIPYPEHGPQSESWDEPAVAIWCAWISPETHEPELGPVGKLTVKLDNGKTVPRYGFLPAESFSGSELLPGTAYTIEQPTYAEDYRVAVIVNPPRDSRYLRVAFRMWGVTGNEIVRFKIKNPAYGH